MGNISIQNFDSDDKNISLKAYKNFKVNISQIMMSHAKSYKLWAQENTDKSVITDVIQDFSLNFILSMIKGKNK